jgi:DNA mismatch endonuclease (patch repair protein)
VADVFTRKRRSQIMARITGRHTAPERAVAALLRSLRVRFRRHAAELPGRPDFFIPSRNAAVFVHGCFWHGHSGCRRARLPTTRAAFWRNKIAGNRRRDRRIQAALRRQGRRVMVIWQCRMGPLQRLAARLARFLARPRRRPRPETA